jgi:hypothetical protein
VQQLVPLSSQLPALPLIPSLVAPSSEIGTVSVIPVSATVTPHLTSPSSISGSAPQTPVTPTSSVTPRVHRTSLSFTFSYDSLIEMLRKNSKTQDIKFNEDRTITVGQRKKIVAVCTSKLIETESAYPCTASKKKLASLLSQLTKIPESAFFEPKTFKGFISSYLENVRAKLSPSKRRYSWSNKARSNHGIASQSMQADGTTTECAIPEAGTCPRGLTDCELCQGNYTLYIDVVWSYNSLTWNAQLFAFVSFETRLSCVIINDIETAFHNCIRN